MKTATMVKRLDGWISDARLYKLGEPLDGFDHVVVSAVVAYSGPETLIFGCDSHGRPADYSDLRGSIRGIMDHAEALAGAGYEVTP
jgi:hypothetical protein